MDARDDTAPSPATTSASDTAAAPSAGVRMPELIDIPGGAGSKLCECGVRLWWVQRNGKRIPVACSPTLATRAGLIALACVIPEHGKPGLGINHYIDCPKRRKFDTRIASPAGAHPPLTNGLDAPPPLAEPDERGAAIRAAEALAETHGVRCTGAPFLRDTCAGFAVICFVLDGRLFAAPCAAHADAVQTALKRERPRSCEAHALQRYLAEKGPDVAARFAKRCALIREWNTERGFHIPVRGSAPA